MFDDILSLISKCALVLACMVLHELGHILVAHYYHVPIKKIGFSKLGMYIQRTRSAGWPEVATCLGGPAMNLVLTVAFWHVNGWFALCNLTFAGVNLLPLAHSDGSHAWEAFRAMHQRASA